MAHLFVDLYDRLGGRLPCCTLDDHEVSNRQYFHDLNQRAFADQAARVVVRCGDEYRTGDHIRLLDQARPSHTDTIAVDPAIADDVDLNQVIFDNHGFADRAEAILIVTNPNPDSSFRLRVSLYDQVGQQLPSLVFYDWEYPAVVRLTDLDLFHFANKAAFIRVERGPTYQEGDRIILWETLEHGSRTQALEPGNYDLNQIMLLEKRRRGWRSFIRERKCWADTVAGIELDLQPQVVRH
jgi:hypothetical protein